MVMHFVSREQAISQYLTLRTFYRKAGLTADTFNLPGSIGNKLC